MRYGSWGRKRDTIELLSTHSKSFPEPHSNSQHKGLTPKACTLILGLINIMPPRRENKTVTPSSQKTTHKFLKTLIF